MQFCSALLKVMWLSWGRQRAMLPPVPSDTGPLAAGPSGRYHSISISNPATATTSLSHQHLISGAKKRKSNAAFQIVNEASTNLLGEMLGILHWCLLLALKFEETLLTGTDMSLCTIGKKRGRRTSGSVKSNILLNNTINYPRDSDKHQSRF